MSDPYSDLEEDFETGPLTSPPTVLLTQRCDTCIYWENGARMHLVPGRTEDMTEETIERDTNVICHKSESVMGEWDFDAWCFGNYKAKGPGQMMRIQGRLNLLERRRPPKGKAHGTEPISAGQPEGALPGEAGG